MGSRNKQKVPEDWTWVCKLHATYCFLLRILISVTIIDTLIHVDTIHLVQSSWLWWLCLWFSRSTDFALPQAILKSQKWALDEVFNSLQENQWCQCTANWKPGKRSIFRWLRQGMLGCCTCDWHSWKHCHSAHFYSWTAASLILLANSAADPLQRACCVGRRYSPHGIFSCSPDRPFLLIWWMLWKDWKIYSCEGDGFSFSSLYVIVFTRLDLWVCFNERTHSGSTSSCFSTSTKRK